MNNGQLHKLGIDIGSTTVKIAILDDSNQLLFSDYERHFANIQETLSSLIEKAYNQLGELSVSPMITGSGGLCSTMLPRQMSQSSWVARMRRSSILKVAT